MAPAEFFACVFLFQQTIIFWIYLFPQFGRQLFDLDFTSLMDLKRVVDFSACSAFQLLEQEWRFHTLYMPDWKLEVRGRPCSVKMGTVLGKPEWLVTLLWSGDLWDLFVALQSPLGHDFQCLEASVSFSVKRERVDFGLISVYQIWFSLCWVFLRQVISGLN